ncbi:hypothetical protein ScalyP_jg8310 [Parmales sp. scaly parma]|nr:hypothetical protein ScalyP_jg8310 [Parmales sp. scaly parma]
MNFIASSGLTPLMDLSTPANFFGQIGGGASPSFGSINSKLQTVGGNDMSTLMPSTRNSNSDNNSFRMSVDISNVVGIGNNNNNNSNSNINNSNRPLSAKGRMLFFKHIGGDLSNNTNTNIYGGSNNNSRRSKPKRKSPLKTNIYSDEENRIDASAKIVGKAMVQQRLKIEQPSDNLSAISRTCRCKKSRCLKLYCECFAAAVYCTSETCKCADCNNLEAFERERVEAIECALSRNPDAFDNKLTKATKRANMTGSNGCNCKRSVCLKKYCECFFTGNLCGKTCKCINCENWKDSKALVKKRKELSLLLTEELAA